MFEHGGVEIDHCVGCRGTWLDGGELEMIVEFAGVPSGDFTEALDRAGDGSRTKRRCPRCARRMRTIDVGEEPTVELDRCTKGHGLWFDSGELKQIVDSVAEGDGGAISRFFAELYHHEFQEVSQAEGQEA